MHLLFFFGINQCIGGLLNTVMLELVMRIGRLLQDRCRLGVHLLVLADKFVTIIQWNNYAVAKRIHKCSAGVFH